MPAIVAAALGEALEEASQLRKPPPVVPGLYSFAAAVDAPVVEGKPQTGEAEERIAAITAARAAGYPGRK